MKTILSIGLLVLSLASLGVAQLPTTTGDYSPAVVARDFQATYGIRTDAVQAILAVYQQQGLTEAERKSKTEDLIKAYRSVAPKTKGVSSLGTEAQQRLGIIAQPGLVAALNWDMFAQQYYLSTSGANSPAIVAAGDVSIWYGIPEPALRTLAGRLEANAVELGEFGTQLQELAEKYEALKKEFEIYGPGDPVVRQAEKLLDEGRLEEAEALLESDYRVSKKRLAYKAYLFGKTKELLLKYEEAAEGYRDAVGLDGGNVEYLIAHGNNERILAHYDSAIHIFEAGLNQPALSQLLTKAQRSDLLGGIGSCLYSMAKYDQAIEILEQAMSSDSIASASERSRDAKYLNNIGLAWNSKGAFDKALEFYEQALLISQTVQGIENSQAAEYLNNIGEALSSKGEYDKAIGYYEKAIGICSIIDGERHPSMASKLNNLGAALEEKGEYEKAIGYYQKALKINLAAFGSMHPDVAVNLNNLAIAFHSKGKYDTAIAYFEKALEVDTIIFGNRHPNVARDYNNLGSTWKSMGRLDVSVAYYHKAIDIAISVHGKEHPSVATYLNNLGTALDSKKDYDLAISYYKQSLSIGQNVLGQNHPQVGMIWNNLGVSFYGKGDYDNAILHHQKAIEIETLIWGNDNQSVSRNFYNIGMAFAAKGDHIKAIENEERALEILKRLNRMNQPLAKKICRNLAKSDNIIGLELLDCGDLVGANSAFEKAFLNAELAEDKARSVICLNYMGCCLRQMGEYLKAMVVLDEGARRADSIYIVYSNSETLVRDSSKGLERYMFGGDSLLLHPFLRQLSYHKIGCLEGLNRKKEAKTLAKQLTQEALAAKDEDLLQLLKNDGWLKE